MGKPFGELVGAEEVARWGSVGGDPSAEGGIVVEEKGVAELENALSHHPDVIESAAVASPDPVLGEKIHIFVRAASPSLQADDVRRFCADRLADYKIPDYVTFLDAPLPRNANGKVLKTVLREQSA